MNTIFWTKRCSCHWCTGLNHGLSLQKLKAAASSPYVPLVLGVLLEGYQIIINLIINHYQLFIIISSRSASCYSPTAWILDLVMRNLSKCFMEKLKIPTNQLAILYRQNALKFFIFTVIILIWEHHLLLLRSIKVFKKASMGTGFFTKMFYLKVHQCRFENLPICLDPC